MRHGTLLFIFLICIFCIFLFSTAPAIAAFGSCAGQPNGTPCDDGNECTIGDSCVGGTCSLSINAPNGTPCTSDGAFCTGVEACQNGSCVSPGDPCPGPDGDADCIESCNEAADNCSVPDPNGSACNDGNECTTADVCNSGTCSASVIEPDGTPCTSDGLFCTGVESCQSGACTGAGDPCGGIPGGGGTCGGACDEATDTCDPIPEWGLTVTVSRNAGVPSDLDLSWSANCLAAADYAVYEGTLGDFSSHVPVGTPACTTGGATTTTFTPGAANRYYLVVPLDPAGGTEGSYGFASDWTPRAQSLSPCEPSTVCDCGAAPTRTIFVTSTTYTGNLGGLAGADAKCQTRAAAAGLVGTYKAWASDATDTAANRLTHSSVPYVRTDGQTIADNWNDLTDNPSTDPLLAAVDLDENGNTVPTKNVWTGSNFQGGTLSTFHCSNWVDGTNASSGRQGRSNRVDLGWTSFSSNGCDSSARLYCLEQ